MARSSAKKTRKRLYKARKRQTRRERETDSSVPEHGDPTRPDKIRMSEVISHVAKPLFDKFGDTTRDLEFIITLTVFAWNLALLPPDVREETLEKLLLEKFASDPELAANFRSYYDLVAERKARFYPHLQRMIIDVKFRRESESQVFFEVLHQPVTLPFDGKPN